MANSTKREVCILDGCDGPANVPGTAKGYCRKHYARFRKYGDPSVVMINIHNDPICMMDGCDRSHLAKGLCGYHYALRRESLQASCAVSSCDLPVKCRGWCQAHYMRWKKTGDVQAHRPLRGHLPAGSAWCPSCEMLKPVVGFVASKERNNGVASYCRPCFAELMRTKYRDANYVRQKRWRAANPDRTAQYGKDWAAKNPDKVRAKAARQKAANPERYRLYARAGEQNRRARERSAPGRATSAQIEARWAYYGHRCWMCGDAAQVTDHVKPLSKGGSNWPANLRPACMPCNNSKRAKWPFPLEVARVRRASGRETA